MTPHNGAAMNQQTVLPEYEAQTEMFTRLVEQRWSCRAYLPDPVPHEQIGNLLRIAQNAPSWCNTQPWGVIVTEGNATERFRAGLLAHAKEQAPAHAPTFRCPR